jgi:Insecticidal Crystal Toxin, P42/Vacuolar protein sorting-associated protein 62
MHMNARLVHRLGAVGLVTLVIASGCGGDDDDTGSGGASGRGGSGGQAGKSGATAGKGNGAGGTSGASETGGAGANDGGSARGGNANGGVPGTSGGAPGTSGGAPGASGGAPGASEGGASGAGVGDLALLNVDMSFTSLLPGEQEFLTVHAVADDGSNDTATASSADHSVATASLTGETLVITAGAELGETTVTVKSGAGLTKTVDVLVSNPRALKIGNDLLVAYVDDYDLLYNDAGSGADLDGSFWSPQVANGFYAVGHLDRVGHDDPSGQMAMIVVKPLVDDAVAAPTDYTYIWDDSGSGASMDGSFWKPVCPTNYSALGTVGAVDSHAKPPLDAIRCVRSDLVEPAAIGDPLWNDGGSGADDDFGSWGITVPPDSDSEGTVPLVSGSFVGSSGYTKPTSDPAANMLRITVPIVREVDESKAFPRLTSLLPPDETTPVQTGRAVLIPFTAVNDDARDFDYKVKTSPFYQLDRDVYYRLLVDQYNETDVAQEIDHDVTSGVSMEQTQEFSITTGISVSVTGGVNFIADATATVTVSLELGYSSSTTIGEFTQQSVTKDITIPPHSAIALWQLIDRFTLKRRNGNVWETVGTPWEIGVDSFVVDQYPH